jgi:hypothetical protein
MGKKSAKGKRERF